MQKHIVFGIGGIVIGLAAGFYGANAINRNAAQSPSAAKSPQAAVTAPDGSAVQAGGMQNDVADVLARAQAEPDNFAVQMRTGDMYAQIGRFEKAI